MASSDRAALPDERAAREQLMQLSNWGRWGDDDERGAVNLVDGAAIARGLAAVRNHKVYALGAVIDGATAPHLPSTSPPQHFMARDGGDWLAAEGDEPEGGFWSDRQVASDTVLISPHGTTSHIDGLSHVWSEHLLYNGFQERDIRSDGARRLGIEKLKGIVTRAVFFDMAAHRGVERLDANDLITAADLQACEERQGVEVTSGDAVLIHTGWPTMYQEDRVAYSGRQPGIGATAGLYLAQKDVCLVGSDNTAVQIWPGPAAEAESDPRAHVSDIHIPFLRNLGVYLIEMLDLSELASDAVSECLLTVAPLRIRGGTASSVNPIAVT